MSHGFNIVSVNRAFKAGDWTYRFGAGPVITHAEATILGTKYDGPYRLSGAALLTGVGKRFHIGTSTYIAVEGALTVAYAKPHLAGTPSGELTVTNFAAHALIGVGHEL